MKQEPLRPPLLDLLGKAAVWSMKQEPLRPPLLDLLEKAAVWPMKQEPSRPLLLELLGKTAVKCLFQQQEGVTPSHTQLASVHPFIDMLNSWPRVRWPHPATAQFLGAWTFLSTGFQGLCCPLTPDSGIFNKVLQGNSSNNDKP